LENGKSHMKKTSHVRLRVLCQRLDSHDALFIDSNLEIPDPDSSTHTQHNPVVSITPSTSAENHGASTGGGGGGANSANNKNGSHQPTAANNIAMTAGEKVVQRRRRRVPATGTGTNLPTVTVASSSRRERERGPNRALPRRVIISQYFPFYWTYHVTTILF
jgi:hypothetical protein